LRLWQDSQQLQRVLGFAIPDFQKRLQFVHRHATPPEDQTRAISIALTVAGVVDTVVQSRSASGTSALPTASLHAASLVRGSCAIRLPWPSCNPRGSPLPRNDETRSAYRSGLDSGGTARSMQPRTTSSAARRIPSE